LLGLVGGIVLSCGILEFFEEFFGVVFGSQMYEYIMFGSIKDRYLNNYFG
jgi:hypothetical protein